MKRRILITITFLLQIIHTNAQDQTLGLEIVTVCPEEIPISQLSSEINLYFTLPDDDANLSIWYFSSGTVVQTPIVLSIDYLLSISPSGENIIAIKTDTDYVSRNLFYAYFGATISEILVIDTLSYEVTSLEIPEWINEHRYIKRVQWYDESTFSLVDNIQNRAK